MGYGRGHPETAGNHRSERTPYSLLDAVRTALAAPWLAPLLVLLAAAVAGANTLSMDFTWDDFPQVRDNTLLRSLTGIGKLFVTNISAGTSHYDPNVPYYRPLAMVTFALDRFFWGENPFGYHLTNLLLHAGVSLLVWRLALVLAGPAAAICAGLLFAVHPVHAETLAWISARFDLLAALFTAAAFGSYLAFREKRGSRFPAASLLFFLAALLSKEMAITLPLLVFLYETCRETSRLGESCRRAGAFLAVALIYYGVRVAVLHNHSLNTYPLVWHLATTPVLVTEYLRLLLLPFDLTIFYDVAIRHTLLDPEVAGKGALLAALAAGVLRLHRYDRPVQFGLLWLFAALLPVSGLVTFPLPNLVTERYLYLPSVGLCLAAGALFTRLRAPAASPGTVTGGAMFPPAVAGSAPPLILAATVAILLAVTCTRNHAWQDDLHLFACRLHPETAQARYCRGVLSYRGGNFPEAVREFTRALQLDPGRAEAHNDLGITLAAMGNFPESRREFQAALAVKPDMTAASDNLARLGFLEEIDKNAGGNDGSSAGRRTVREDPALASDGK